MKQKTKLLTIITLLCISLLTVCSGLTVFAAVKSTTVSEGRYWLKNLNGKYLTMTDDKNGGTLKMASLDKSSKKQVFIQEKDGSNKYYTLTAYGSGSDRVVNVYADKSASGKKVVLYDKVTKTSACKTQRWYWVYDSKNKAYSLRPADNTKLALTVSGSTVKLAAYKENNKNQLWKFVEIPVTSVKLDSAGFAMKRGTSCTLKATVTPAFATNKSLTWKSNNSRVTVDSKGKVTVSSSAKLTNTARITVANNTSGKSASCLITPVANVPVSSVSLNTASANLIPGQTKTLTAVIKPATATEKGVTWKSSDIRIVSVNSKGVLTAKKDGTATITVTTNDKKKTAKCKVTVSSSYAMKFSIYNQGYKDWRNSLMGTDDKNATIGMYGCTTTCLAGIENYYNEYVFGKSTRYTPKTIAKQLKYKKGYLQGSGLWTEKYYDSIGTSYKAIFNQVKKGNPVLVQLLLGKDNYHWVVIYGYQNVKYENGEPVLSASNFLVADPGGKSKLGKTKKYGSTGKALLSTIYQGKKITKAKIRTKTVWK